MIASRGCFDLGIGHALAANVMFAVPGQCFHGNLPVPITGQNPTLKGSFRVASARVIISRGRKISQIRQSILGADRIAPNQGGATGSSSSSFVTQPRPDLWRASKLTGLNVYNETDEKSATSMRFWWIATVRQRPW